MTTLFVQYSPGNICLMKCGNCKAVADEYIECEPIIMLHKTKAYTHLLYNVIDPQAPSFQGLLWKSTFGFLLLDACIHYHACQDFVFGNLNFDYFCKRCVFICIGCLSNVYRSEPLPGKKRGRMGLVHELRFVTLEISKGWWNFYWISWVSCI
ncbi:unnamed protein product [Malus baccata var. baccata]